MDLVCVSDNYMKGGNSVLGSKNNLFQFGAF
jgi:non-canonical poly(A) RNA polymerase PAPD5/7